MTLCDFFKRCPKVAVALSGGVDSVYLMNEAKACGADVRAYFVKTEFQPEFELRDAHLAAKAAEVPLCVISFSVLDDENTVKNGEDRCYYCKRAIMQIITATAKSDGYDVICDGTNASDDISDRPGYRALGELSVISPLRICGISKAEVRKRAKAMGLSVWNKPSYACLATRIPQNERITEDTLRKTENAEDYLRNLGFSDFRVRVSRGNAKVELCSKDRELALLNMKKLEEELKKYYLTVLFDLEARNEKLFD
ncbi:MAG: ATP-dependent sacrificial sulfur transferase LarE [Oscillospiraceae bacterium]|nr:ATP-dependent sacrificial sulfur transferase LarE [Oscillospiraceae bacterium]MBQ4544983.1 ATP-dependent sacrificial sulfur transferase LarE [Oscillospiraceae bacterium]